MLQGYTPKAYRDLIPYGVFAREDGNYRNNVILISKGGPLDLDFAAPISPLDGTIRKNLYGSEVALGKPWPASWFEKWKWWMEQDNYRNGPCHPNKHETACILGASKISPSPAWTSCPLNMVNYYGMGILIFQWIRFIRNALDRPSTTILICSAVSKPFFFYRMM